MEIGHFMVCYVQEAWCGAVCCHMLLSWPHCCATHLMAPSNPSHDSGTTAPAAFRAAFLPWGEEGEEGGGLRGGEGGG